MMTVGQTKSRIELALEAIYGLNEEVTDMIEDKEQREKIEELKERAGVVAGEVEYLLELYKNYLTLYVK